MAKDFSDMEDSNRSANLSIHDVSDPARRTILRGGLGVSLAGLLGSMGPLAGCTTTAHTTGATMGFKSVPATSVDRISVPEGYTAEVLAPWGEPVGIAGNMPAFRFDASNTAAE
ncbi:MAG: PhoX family phosphatase, partial [Rubrivivax sp.]|nr:PhoX family phosphatase [Rubrivivax sp.]